MPSISVRNKLASILEQSEWKMLSLELHDEKVQLQEKLQKANVNIAQLTAQLAQVVIKPCLNHFELALNLNLWLAYWVAHRLLLLKQGAAIKPVFSSKLDHFVR